MIQDKPDLLAAAQVALGVLSNIHQPDCLCTAERDLKAAIANEKAKRATRTEDHDHGCDLCDQRELLLARAERIPVAPNITMTPEVLTEAYKRMMTRAGVAEAEVEKLKAFKTYVHGRLDAAGVPKEFDDQHAKEGCRIGGRLDWLIANTCQKVEDARDARLAKLERIAAAAKKTTWSNLFRLNQQDIDEITRALDDLEAK